MQPDERPPETGSPGRGAKPGAAGEYVEAVEDGRTVRFRKGDPMEILRFVESCGDASELVAALKEAARITRGLPSRGMYA